MRSPGIHALRESLKDALCQGIDEKTFSGAEVSFCVNDGPICTAVAGTTAWDARAVTPDTLFDIASLTKLFTATVALTLVDDGTLSLNTPIWRDFTLEKLLAHETGLPGWKPFFEDIAMGIRGTAQAYRQIVAAVLSTPADVPPSQTAVYSDLGYIGLAHQLQQLTGQSLTALVQTRITTPLNLHHTFFCPEIQKDQSSIAATESCPWRGRVLQGEVHDDNAWTMGGVAGHAGIFSTSHDMAAFGAAWLNALHRGGLISASLAQKAIERRPGGRALGFDLKSPGVSGAGPSASERTFGHLGFTGTSLWIDPTRNAVIALLTNRVHPSRENNGIREFRPRFHELFWRSI
ncbi:MAG: beta-lactamase family protein [Deltaproteobacteria bacterium]|nr:beta-lactamase family protein [Deltaproteobacteria bacterium]